MSPRAGQGLRLQASSWSGVTHHTLGAQNALNSLFMSEILYNFFSVTFKKQLHCHTTAFPPPKKITKNTKKIASAISSLILFKKLCTLLISVKHLEADVHTSQQSNPTLQAA